MAAPGEGFLLQSSRWRRPQDLRTKRIPLRLRVSLDLFLARPDSFMVTQLHWRPASGAELLVKPSELGTARLDPPGEQPAGPTAAAASDGAGEVSDGFTLRLLRRAAPKLHGCF